jgi:hypothetical protein
MADKDRMTEDEAALAPFFAAARAGAAEPSPALLAAILADAAAASAARRQAPARRRPGLRQLPGGWRVAMPLAAAAAAGFWIGFAADLGSADPSAWTVTAAAEDPVTGFFDLAAAEN